ncbi:hypothetical protein GCM10022226_21620 [Sphaerisporangium flaviroseum]|uniref:non-specific serine/threonine protein kinase n=1 Tax=Sphaerisporangium flaviroseum TaxID=509199 RepID=A0ABP7HRX0_9ACTN
MITDAPLSRSDPTEIGGYSLVARLREDDAACVYLAQDPSGDRVDVMWMRDGVVPDDASGRLSEAVRKLAVVSVSSIVQTISSGVQDGRPYIVSEHVDGVSLREAVERDGPLRETALHRMAISTMTALVALHQAGIAHGDLHPGNVLLGPDGVRVSGSGMAQAMPVDGEGSTRALASIAYLPPERFESPEPEPPGDLFAWAATLVYAATGHDAFDGGSTAATINLVMRGQADLDALDDHLRGVAAACLDKDPAERPAAADALLGLVGHSMLTIAGEPPPGVTAPDPVPGPWPRRLLLGAGALVVIAASATAGHLLAAGSIQAAPRAPATTPTPSLNLAATAPRPVAPPEVTSKVSLPGIDATLHENPADPQRFVAYRGKGGAYVRAVGTTRFTPAGLSAKDVTSAADGSRLAFLGDGADSGTVVFVDRDGSGRFSVAVPASARRPVFDRDARRLLLTLTSGKDEVPTGFVVVDVGRRTMTEVDTDEETQRGEGVYAWLPDGSGVTVSYKTERDYGMRIRDLAGREVRTMDWVGFSTGRRMFSPSGRQFLTLCPSGGTYCAWETGTGVRRASFSVTFDYAEFWGWYDENHVLVLDPSKDPHRILVMDFLGRPQRTMATIKASDDAPDLFFTRADR